MKKILVLANGEMPERKNLAVLAREKDYVVCCDGAYNKALKAGIRPDLVIGDMDSLKGSVNPAVKTIKIPDRDSTDLEKSLNYLVESGIGSGSQIVIVGASGGRTDFTLYNLHLLMRFRHLDLFLVDSFFTAFLVSKRCEIRGTRKGTLISFLPMAQCQKVRAEGLEYPLKNVTLVPGGLESISNRAISGSVRISLASGNLVCFISHEPKNFKALPRVLRSPR